MKRFVAVVALASLASACSKDTPPPRQPGPYGGPGIYGSPYAAPPRPMPPPQQSPAVFRPVNVGALLAALPMSPCAPAEVSPGNWVGFDCTPNAFINRALQTMVSSAPAQGGNTQAFGQGMNSKMSLAGAGLPEVVDHRSIGLEGPVKNQGAVGTCTAVSLSTAMEAALRRMGVGDNVSALHVWSNYARPSMGSAGDGNIDKRIAPSTTWPYDPAAACKLMKRSFDSCGPAYGVTPNTGAVDPQIQSQKKAADAAGRYTLVGVERIANPDPARLAKIIASGDDLWVAFDMHKASWRNSAMKNGVIPDYTGDDGTGHAVVLAGYRNVGSVTQFLIHNSWGKSWGQQGYAWISENMVRTKLRSAYRVRVAHAGGSTPPLPGIAGLPSIPGLPRLPGVPQGQPQGGGACAQGQVADLVSGQCVAACPNGYPPAAGVCAPSVPGMSNPGQPAPQQGQPAKSCAQGQVADMVSGECVSPCPGGNAPMGGLCLPQLPSQ